MPQKNVSKSARNQSITLLALTIITLDNHRSLLLIHTWHTSAMNTCIILELLITPDHNLPLHSSNQHHQFPWLPQLLHEPPLVSFIHSVSLLLDSNQRKHLSQYSASQVPLFSWFSTHCSQNIYQSLMWPKTFFYAEPWCPTQAILGNTVLLFPS